MAEKTAAKVTVELTREEIIHAAACVGRNIGRVDQPMGTGNKLRRAAEKIGVTWEEIHEYGNKLSFGGRDRGQCAW